MFYDKAKIYVEGGRGGDGCVSFRREAHVAKGGPDGGDGGRGGDVVVIADESRRDLSFFRHKKHFKAGKGGHGSGALKTGADGDSIELQVAVGTVVEDLETGAIFDLAGPGKSAVVARGGSGGYGNKHFAGPTRQTPRFAQKGLTGESLWLDLRLKLLADVGLIGKPNAGKSSLLKRITRAQPKVADYAFTTLEPVLGTIEFDDRQIVIADIPGLIEGASKGAGLGHDFLAHVERTELLVHLVDIAPVDGSDPFSDYELIGRELELHDIRLAGRPRIVALNKADLVEESKHAALLDSWQEYLGGDAQIHLISAASGQGLERLKGALAQAVPAQRSERDVGQVIGRDREQRAVAEHRTYKPAEGMEVEVELLSDGVYHLAGKVVERLVERTDVDNPEALDYLEQRLNRLGVFEQLERLGFRSGDQVEMAGFAFELHTEGIAPDKR